MAVLFDETVTLEHVAFQQAGPVTIGLPRPIGTASVFYELDTGSSADSENSGFIKPQGVGAYAYTLQDVSIMLDLNTSVSTVAQSDAFVAFMETASAGYEHYPLLAAIDDQARFSASIQRVHWAFRRTTQYQQWVTISSQSYPKGGRVVLIIDRNAVHSAKQPTAIPETWSDSRSPLLELGIGALQTFLVNLNARIRIGLTYLYWPPGERLAAMSHAELPVRGT